MMRNHPALPGRKKKNRKFVCVFASFQLPLAQNNPYVRVQMLGWHTLNTFSVDHIYPICEILMSHFKYPEQ